MKDSIPEYFFCALISEEELKVTDNLLSSSALATITALGESTVSSKLVEECNSARVFFFPGSTILLDVE